MKILSFSLLKEPCLKGNWKSKTIWEKTNDSVMIRIFFTIIVNSIIFFSIIVQFSPNQLSHPFPKFPKSTAKTSVSLPLLSIHTQSISSSCSHHLVLIETPSLCSSCDLCPFTTKLLIFLQWLFLRVRSFCYPCSNLDIKLGQSVSPAQRRSFHLWVGWWPGSQLL